MHKDNVTVGEVGCGRNAGRNGLPARMLFNGSSKKGPKTFAMSIAMPGGRCPFASPICSKLCYAAVGKFPLHTALYEKNYQATIEPDFVDRACNEISGLAWKNAGGRIVVCAHEKGELHSLEYLQKWGRIIHEMRSFPNVSFFIYTRSWINKAFRQELDLIASRNRNVRINLSTDRSMNGKWGVPPRVGNGMIVHLAETDTDVPPAGVDIVLRNLRVRDHAPMERINGILVCPNESGMYIAKEDGIPVIKDGKAIRIRCQDCRLCIDRGPADWEQAKGEYAGTPGTVPRCEHAETMATEGGSNKGREFKDDKNSKSKHTVGSLFAGIGGICLGFRNAGCEVLWANEFDKHACRTYRHNFKHKLVEADIHSITNPLEELGYVDIVTSGFPCQAFSIAGYQKGFSDPRGNLFFETARFIDDIKPRAFILENVRNLYSHDNGNTFKVIEKFLTEKLGYSFIPFVLNSKDYGNIPQTRERIYIVGFRGESRYVHSNKDKLLVSENERKTVCTYNFEIPFEIPLTKTIRDMLEKGQQPDKYYYQSSWVHYEKLNQAMFDRNTVYQWRRVYVRENKSNVCPTLTANMGTGGHNVPVIIDDFGFRKLTPKECTRFQGFPEEFSFPEGMSNCHRYKQAGNSVVVPVVERIARAIIVALDSCVAGKPNSAVQ